LGHNAAKVASIRGGRVGIWDVLGIEATEDRSAIRRAYAARLKLTNPEDDPEGFQALRAAYEAALRPGASRALVRAAPDPDGADRDADEEDWDDGPAATPSDPAVAAAYQALAEVLNAPISPEPRAVLAAWEALFYAFDAAPVSETLAYEGPVARLINWHEPRSDVLIIPATARFGWDERFVYGEGRWEVEQVLARRDDPAFRLGLDQNDHPLNTAYWLLGLKNPWWLKPYVRLSPGLLRDMQELLAILDTRPDLLDELKPATVRWWRERVAHPFPGPLLLSGLLFIGLMMLPSLVAPGSYWAIAGQGGAILIATLATVAALPAYLQQRLLRTHRRSLRLKAVRIAPAVSLAGFAGLAGLLLASTLVPPSLGAGVAIGLLTLPLLAVLALFGRPDRRSGIYDRPLERVTQFDASYVWLFFSAFSLAAPVQLQAAVPMAAVFIGLSMAGDSLIEALVRRPPVVATVFMGLGLGLALLASPVLILAAGAKDPPAWPTAAIIVPMLLAYSVFGAEAGRIRRWVKAMIVIPTVLTLYPPTMPLVVVAELLLAPAVMSLILFVGAVGQFGRKRPRQANIPRR
jgi:hypothetical protein